MKKLTGNIAAKITAIILSYVMAVIVAVSVIGFAFMLNFDFYSKSKAEIKKDVLTDMASSESYKIYNLYNNSSDDSEYLKSQYSSKNVYYKIEDSDGNEICSNYDGQDYEVKYVNDKLQTYKTVEKYDENGEVYADEEVVNGTVSVTVYIPKKMSNTDRFLLAANLIDKAYSFKYSVFVIGLLSFALFIALMSFLYCSAGHRNSSSVVKLNYSDRIPFDIYTAFVTVAIVLIGLFLGSGFYHGTIMWIIIPILCTVAYFIVLGFTMSFATRLKTGTLIKNTVIYRILKLLGRWFGKGLRACKHLFLNISLVKKTVLIIAGTVLVEFIIVCMSMYSPQAIFIWWLIFTWVLSVLVLFIAISLQKIKKGGEKIAAGDLEYKIDTKYMNYEFKEFAESLNNINLGLQNAVNEKMKSERFKTELITNVSHDIKTPLTSIINYVDLIKKEEPESETMRQYIDVLDRQSGRLKKLIEDLVEASKASTGNLAVNLTECEVGVLLSQTIGEFDERLLKANITPVLKQPQSAVKIMADGRHLWRVFDNLMSNVCKYSQLNTRVYMDVCEKNGKAVITFRNISKYELNISSEELMERFVRGDSSRNTEGSGLGLSIAKSLVELQNGQMELNVDGDLFKVTLTFNAI